MINSTQRGLQNRPLMHPSRVKRQQSPLVRQALFIPEQRLSSGAQKRSHAFDARGVLLVQNGPDSRAYSQQVIGPYVRILTLEVLDRPLVLVSPPVESFRKHLHRKIFFCKNAKRSVKRVVGTYQVLL